ncbi:MAG: FHA domain-containing protein [Nannocystaceae bacterium]|nr:FHA domain-containing protein [bacterium]
MTTVALQIGSASATLDASRPRHIIGRDEQSASIVAAHPTVSRRHCEVYLENGYALIRDMGSSNGTWINGHPVGQQPVQLAPGQHVFVGHMPLSVTWSGGGQQQGATVMGELPADLKALIDARKQQAAVSYSTPPVVASSEAQNMTYRRQGSNDNGVFMIALPNDDFTNDMTIKGFSEFTAMDSETVDEITIELVEVHKKGPRKGHVWDRVLVKKGPWKCKKNDRVPMPFELRVPQSTSISGKDVHWEIRGCVDIAWAYDVEVEVPVTMHNADVEKVRDAMGALDLRVDSIESKPMGQQFLARFEPPAQWRTQWNIDSVNLDMQYLGTNFQIMLEVDKKGAFSKDRRTQYNVELSTLRQASLQQVSEQLLALIQRMLSL